jgi:hypothetical protein
MDARRLDENEEGKDVPVTTIEPFLAGDIGMAGVIVVLLKDPAFMALVAFTFEALLKIFGVLSRRSI